MQVIDKELFHIHRQNYHRGLWKPGNILSTPVDLFNNFYTGISTEPHSNVSIWSKQVPLIEHLGKEIDKFYEFNDSISDQELSPDNISNIQSFNSHILNILDKTFTSLTLSRKMLRETIFENYRNQYFSELPSRQKCFWLSDKEQIQQWWDEFNDCKNKLIYKVSVTGKLFYTDGSLIQMDVFRLTDFSELAKRYWEGHSNSNPDLIKKEYIFEGELKILSEYTDPSQL